MKLATTSTSPLGEPGFEYKQQIWGDLIHGTKEQLQRIGLAVGRAFPGEPDGPKRRLNTTDHRGFPVLITEGSHNGDGIYSASIPFPGRDSHPPKRVANCAPGVRKSSDHDWCDEYVGTPTALAAAGLMSLDQLPGQPGMRKMRVRILPDGTPQNGRTSNCSEANMPGAKCIKWDSKHALMVTIVVPHEEMQRRSNENDQRNYEWEARMRNLPRPAPLIDLGDDAIPSVKTKPAPKYRADGNVLHLLPRAEGRAAP